MPRLLTCFNFVSHLIFLYPFPNRQWTNLYWFLSLLFAQFWILNFTPSVLMVSLICTVVEFSLTTTMLLHSHNFSCCKCTLMLCCEMYKVFAPHMYELIGTIHCGSPLVYLPDHISHNDWTWLYSWNSSLYYCLEDGILEMVVFPESFNA